MERKSKIAKFGTVGSNQFLNVIKILQKWLRDWWKEYRDAKTNINHILHWQERNEEFLPAKKRENHLPLVAEENALLIVHFCTLIKWHSALCALCSAKIFRHANFSSNFLFFNQKKNAVLKQKKTSELGTIVLLPYFTFFQSTTWYFIVPKFLVFNQISLMLFNKFFLILQNERN